jgi:hypothetical protein
MSFSHSCTFHLNALTFVGVSQVVKEAIASVDGYDANRREAVRKTAQSLNLKKEAAMVIFSKTVCIFPSQGIYFVVAYCSSSSLIILHLQTWPQFLLSKFK